MKRPALMFCLLVVASCASRCSSDELAELRARSGAEVDRDRASHEGDWQRATLGDRFRVGDGLRTGPNSSADLTLLPSGLAHVEPGTVLRFLADAPSSRSRQMAVETGAIEIVAQHIDLEVHTPRALAKVARGSRLKLSTTHEGRERFDLIVGRVVVAHEGSEDTLEQSHPLELQSTQRPRARPTEVDASQPRVATDPSLSASAALTADAAPAHGSSPSDAGVAAAAAAAHPSPNPRPYELVLAQVESSTIHVTEPPIALLLPAPTCEQSPEIRLDGAPIPGDARGAVALLGPGIHQVSLLCGARPVRKAQLRVKRDPAKMDLPKRAQNVRVEADGRRYTVRYQNLLPIVTFAWPGAPGPGPFTLFLSKAARETNYPLEQPEHALASGILSEGEYKFWFGDRSGRRSPATTLRLSFDNTARSAYLSAPVDGSAVPRDGVAVAGAALLRSHVRVQGQDVPLDEKGRFQTVVHDLQGQTAISVRVEHPESGIHYYVRRVR